MTEQSNVPFECAVYWPTDLTIQDVRRKQSDVASYDIQGISQFVRQGGEELLFGQVRGLELVTQRRTFDRQSGPRGKIDRKSTRLNSSHSQISYAVFCLKKK